MTAQRIAAVIGAVGTTWVRVEGFAWVLGTVLAAAVARLAATGGGPSWRARSPRRGRGHGRSGARRSSCS